MNKSKIKKIRLKRYWKLEKLLQLRLYSQLHSKLKSSLESELYSNITINSILGPQPYFPLPLRLNAELDLQLRDHFLQEN